MERYMRIAIRTYVEHANDFEENDYNCLFTCLNSQLFYFKVKHAF